MKFIPNPALLAQLAHFEGVEEALEETAARVADEARRIAPVGTEDDPHPGLFRDSIRSGVAEVDGHKVGRVASDADHAPYVIYGTSDTSAHDTFRRAAETTGATS